MVIPTKGMSSGATTSMLQYGAGSGGLGSDDGFLCQDWLFRNFFSMLEAYPTFFSYFDNVMTGNIGDAAAWQRDWPSILSFIFGHWIGDGGSFGGLAGMFSFSECKAWTFDQFRNYMYEKLIEILQSLGGFDGGDGNYIGADSDLFDEYHGNMGWSSNAGGRISNILEDQHMAAFAMMHHHGSMNYQHGGIGRSGHNYGRDGL